LGLSLRRLLFPGSRVQTQQEDSSMQYYTKQQLQGSARYGGGVLLGNWNEDRCIKETILKDFLDRCGTKQLKIDK
jgi:hypothetical protein